MVDLSVALKLSPSKQSDWYHSMMNHMTFIDSKVSLTQFPLYKL